MWSLIVRETAEFTANYHSVTAAARTTSPCDECSSSKLLTDFCGPANRVAFSLV